MDALEQIANAVLYEGYILWPYRRSARKNQQRWTFGGVYPRGYVEMARAGDRWCVFTECLVLGPSPEVSAELRFLQLVHQSDEDWDEAVEQRVPPGDIALEDVQGTFELATECVAPGLTRVCASLANTSTWHGTERAVAQRHGFMSAHMVLRVRNGTFQSMTDRPPSSPDCAQGGLWPVLVGDTHTMLASPIILEDFPRVAPESPGLLYDSGEIDQLLILNTLALTDDEKAEVRVTDPRARAILERAESLGPSDLARLHDGRLKQLERPVPESVTVGGAEIHAGSLVRLHPRGRADIFDVILDGKLAIVESIEQDFEDRLQLAVTVADDPGRDLGMARMPGHRFFFAPEEVEVEVDVEVEVEVEVEPAS